MVKTATQIKSRRKAAYQNPPLPAFLDPKARLAAFRQIRGMWKNRKPDPIKELKKMRKEWERKLPYPQHARHTEHTRLQACTDACG